MHFTAVVLQWKTVRFDLFLLNYTHRKLKTLKKHVDIAALTYTQMHNPDTTNINVIFLPRRHSHWLSYLMGYCTCNRKGPFDSVSSFVFVHCDSKCKKTPSLGAAEMPTHLDFITPTVWANISSVINVTKLKQNKKQTTKLQVISLKIVSMIGNTTITNRRQPRGTARKRRSTMTRHQGDKLSKATSSLFPIKMIAILE